MSPSPRWRALSALLAVPVVLAGGALQPASAQAARAAHHRPVRVTSIREVHGHPKVVVTTRRTPAAAQAALAAAQDAPATIAVSVDTRVHAEVVPSNDTDRWAQWALDRLDAENLWAEQPGNGVVVAVVDTGVDAAHPDLAGVVLPGTDFVTAGGDGTVDGNGHGTHVAGIIAALANNNLGVAGLAQGVKILPVRVLDDTGAGWSSNIAQGVIWATDHGASVINLSLGGSAADDVTAEAVQYAEDHGVVVVAAAGNDRANGDPVTYPAADPGVLGVAASDSQDQIASFSNAGSYVDLAAPGVKIASTYPPDQYVLLSGTSMATPFVSASAALLKAADPQLTVAQATADLESTADDLPPAGRDDFSGYGLVDPAAALCAATGCAADATTTTLRPGARTVRYGRFARGQVTLLDQATGRGLVDATVQLCARATAGSPHCRSLVTDAQGVARYRLRIPGDVTVYADYAGTSTTSASRSDSVDYQVAPRLRVRVHGHRVVAVVRPARAQVVLLQRWTGHQWVRDARTKVGAQGRAVFRGLPGGRFRVRVRTHVSARRMTSAARLVR